MTQLAPVEIVEVDEERDRKECVKLDLKITGANQELAQWLLDHPRYPASAVAGWLGCGATRIKDLRRWAERGFEGKPFIAGRDRRTSVDVALNPLDNFEDDQSEDLAEESEHVASPEVIEENVLDTIGRSMAVASATKKILKVSSLDREAKARISEAIERLTAKWRSTQATLTRKDKGNGNEAHA